jgi:hypothetical protein
MRALHIGLYMLTNCLPVMQSCTLFHVLPGQRSVGAGASARRYNSTQTYSTHCASTACTLCVCMM